MTFFDEDDGYRQPKPKGIYYLFLLIIVFGILAVGFSFQYMTGEIDSTIFTADQYNLALLINGSRSLIANWDAGSFNVTAGWFIGNVQGTITGSISSSNISDWGNFINQAVKTTSSPTFINVSASNFLGNTYWSNLQDIPSMTPYYGTSPNIASITGFNITYRSSYKMAHQGVATNGTHYFTTNSPLGLPNIYVYDDGFNLVQTQNVTGDMPAGWQQINSMYYKDGKLYVGCSNTGTTSYQSWILEYNANTITLAATHTVIGLGWGEGCAFNGTSFWVVYDISLIANSSSYNAVAQYDSSWNYVAQYNLTYPQSESREIGVSGYQGVRFVGNYMFVNTHENVIPQTLDVYYWNGTGFEEYVRLGQPSYWASQGFDFNSDSSEWYFAERYYNGNTSDYRIIKAVPTYGNYHLTGYDSPTSPVYRSLLYSDIPSIDASKIISGKINRDLLLDVYLLRDGSKTLTANWNAGNYGINASYFSMGSAMFRTTVSETYIQVPSAKSFTLYNHATNFYYLHYTDGSGNLYLGSDSGISVIVAGSVTINDGNLILGSNTLTTSNTGLVSNLNADLWDGYQFSDYLNQAVKTTSSPTFATPIVTGITIGANTLTTFEWAYLDGINQALLTSSSPTFVGLLGSPYMDSYGTDYGTILKLDFEEGTGAKAFDSSPYGNDAVITGGTWGTAKFGKGYLSALTNYGTVTDDASLDVSDFTICAWVYPTSTGTYKVILGRRQSGQTATFYYSIRGDTEKQWAVLYVPDYSGFGSNTAIPTNTWSFIALTYNPVTGLMRFYYNGVADGSTNYVGTLNTGASNLYLGSDNAGSNSFVGLLDEVMMYNRVLSANEIKTIWLSGGSRKYSLSTHIADHFRVLGTDLAVDFSVIDGVGNLAGGLTLGGNLVLGSNTLTTSNVGLVSNLNADLWDGYQFSDYLNQAVKTTSSVTFNNVTATNGIVTRYISGDYGAAWASFSPPTGINGLVIVVNNTNGSGSNRLYVYTNGNWYFLGI